MVEHDDLPHFKQSMGDLADRQNDITAAISWYQETVDIFRRMNDLLGLAISLLKLGRCMLAKGDIVEVQAHYEESLKLGQECGSVDVIANAHYNIASLEFSQNQRDSAESNARQALDLFRRLGMQHEQAEAEALLARLGDGTAEALTP